MDTLTLLLESQITTHSDVAGTSIKTAGPEGIPSNSICWLAKEYEGHRIIQRQPNTAQSPTTGL